MRKMFLSPIVPTSSPLLRKMSSLDEERKRILDRTDLDDKTKAQEYSRVLGQYLEVREQYSRSVPIPIVDQQQASAPNINSQLFPQNSRRKLNWNFSKKHRESSGTNVKNWF